MADHAWEMQRISGMVRKVHNSCELMRTDHIYNLTLKIYVAENGTQDQDGLLCILYLTRATLISDRSSGRCCSFLSKGFSSLLLVAALNLSTQCKLHVQTSLQQYFQSKKRKYISQFLCTNVPISNTAHSIHPPMHTAPRYSILKQRKLANKEICLHKTATKIKTNVFIFVVVEIYKETI